MLEVCVESLEAARIAIAAGADRIELSERLDVGGVTPSVDLVRDSVGSAPVVALIRCRPGDFCFDSSQLRQMLDEIQMAIDAGCIGVAVGASRPDDDLNWSFLETIAARHADVALVVHRVFDLVPNPMVAIPRLIELGYRRILTSGGAAHAVNSLEPLREWHHAFGDRIEILPAGGISSSNAAHILHTTGCRQLHGSFRGAALRDGNRFPDPEEIRKVQHCLTNAPTSMR